MSEPSKEAVRIVPSPGPAHLSQPQNAARHDSAGNVLPTRIPVAPVRRLPPQLTSSPTSNSTGAPHVPARIDAASNGSAFGQSGPKKETARIAILPTPAAPPSPALQARQTLPSQIHPGISSTSIPRSFSWLVFGLAALIFLIQILNYVVS